MTSPSDEPLAPEVEKILEEVWEKYSINGQMEGDVIPRALDEVRQRVEALGYRKPH